MFEQYRELKAAVPDAILFYRMGDFYEMFFEDAEIGARVLELTLTSRNRNDPEPIPMAGVPHHASAAYVQKLVDAGYRVAIAEQVEDPRQAKGLVRREIVRVVTPGLVLDPTSLEQRRPCHLVAIARQGDRWGVGFLESTTGDLRIADLEDVASVVAEIERLEPREALVEPGAETRLLSRALRGVPRGSIEAEAWSIREARRELLDTLGVADLAGFGVEDDSTAMRAAGALVRYARDTLGGRLRNVHEIRPYQPAGFMLLDAATRRNLELTRSLMGGGRKGSLLHVLDRTSTSMGSRRLQDWLAFPLLEHGLIRARQAAVATLVEHTEVRRQLTEALKEVADIERIGARVTQGTAHARDLVALRRSLHVVPEVLQLTRELGPLQPHLPHDTADDLRDALDRWLVDDPPLALGDGGLIRRGVHAELDELVELSLEGVGVISRLEEEERARTGISSLKIRNNKVFGYFIEVTSAHLHKVPDRYLRKQTLTQCERYVTPELKELEERVLGAHERRRALEYELFVALREQMAEASARLLAIARRLADLDALTALAEVAVRWRWVAPEIDDDTVVDIRGGRHPVVEAMLEEERFVPNDLHLDTQERQLVVLTGPNMSGKSTIMRQTALIVLLAQMGSFVPAEAARIGLCDRIFTRVGAADDLARGQSTFMVEMSETAAILHQATPRSLVILDEIGRGTSTYDGLAIAWAVAEDIVDRIGCRSIFATHYHELCDLSETRPKVVNLSVAVSETGGDVVFLRRLVEGGASASYGIQCARIAGLPEHVIQRARRLLRSFEAHAPRNERRQLSLFGAVPLPPEVEEPPTVDPVRAAVEALDPDALSPREALEAIYRLRRLCADPSSTA